MQDDKKWPLYTYSINLLNNEETVLLAQARWYLGEDDGVKWIYRTAKTLLHTYYQ
ncbi:hypothetical protein LCGC14_1176460 [marine sediment metagenome]|uniref:Uncharacterized protein n=1 Tax=marine sediment metagenome TaxID=412755 RepID=A0A0F9LT75_9ZZZZ